MAFVCVGNQQIFLGDQWQRLCLRVQIYHGKDTTIYVRVMLGITPRPLQGGMQIQGLVAVTLLVIESPVPSVASSEVVATSVADAS